MIQLMWEMSTAVSAMASHISCVFVFLMNIGFLGGRYAHFFSIPCLTTPTQAFLIDDACASATASWIFTHGYSSGYQARVSNGLFGDLPFESQRKYRLPLITGV